MLSQSDLLKISPAQIEDMVQKVLLIYPEDVRPVARYFYDIFVQAKSVLKILDLPGRQFKDSRDRFIDAIEESGVAPAAIGLGPIPRNYRRQLKKSAEGFRKEAAEVRLILADLHHGTYHTALAFLEEELHSARWAKRHAGKILPSSLLTPAAREKHAGTERIIKEHVQFLKGKIT